MGSRGAGNTSVVRERLDDHDLASVRGRSLDLNAARSEFATSVSLVRNAVCQVESPGDESIKQTTNIQINNFCCPKVNKTNFIHFRLGKVRRCKTMGQGGFVWGEIFFQTAMMSVAHIAFCPVKTRIKQAPVRMWKSRKQSMSWVDCLLSRDLPFVSNCCFFYSRFRLIARPHPP